MPRRRPWLLLALLITVVFVSSTSAEDWPRFRGPTGMGIVSERGLPTTWGGKDDENVLWKVALPVKTAEGQPDKNQSSPIVWGEQVFITEAYWPKGAAQSEFPQHVVACYHVQDGRQLWTKTIEPGPWKLSDLRGGYAAPTPATDGKRLYVLFGSGVLAALDLGGQIVWRKELADATAFDVAIASSPIVYGQQIILLADKTAGKSTLSALDSSSGETIWEQKRPHAGFNHSTPVIVQIGQRKQMLVSSSGELEGLNPGTGERLWWAKTPGDVCSPVLAGQMVYTDSGRGGPGALVDPSGSGDVTGTHIKWTISQIPEGLSSPVVAGEHLYRLHNPGVLKCVALDSGKEAYSKRLDGVSIPSSPLVTPEGLVYFASAGKTFVLKAGPTFELIATNDLGDSGPASAAVAGSRIFLKGRQWLFEIGKKP